VIILQTEQRSAGNAYSGIVHVLWGEDRFTLILQHHPVGACLWQSSLHQTPARIDRDSFASPLWRSRCADYPTDAIDALLEHLAPLGLPCDLIPLVNLLLPKMAIGSVA
jgi:hypothetical protein